MGAAAWLAAGIVANTAVTPDVVASQSAARADSLLVTPAAGPSYLRRLGLSIQRSAMGATGSWGPAPNLVASAQVARGPADPLSLTGADLYRLSCRACHRADGTGAPAEVPSLIDPVQSTSALLMRQRMQAQGRPISPAFAAELASGSREDLLVQLRIGGEKMPAFNYLSRAEVDAVFAYLELLAGVPGAERRQARVTEPATRAGEHLVKGTCHICHDATGAWPDPEALMVGAVPSLAAHRAPAGHAGCRLESPIRRPGRHGTPPDGVPRRDANLRISHRQRSAAAYAYLVAYPPQAIQPRSTGGLPK